MSPDQTQPQTEQQLRAAEQSPERSIFGQVMLWMLLPLMLLWPIGIATTYPIAQAIASRPFDRTLEVESIALAQQTRALYADAPALLANARNIVRRDELDEIIFSVRTPDMNVLIGDARLPRQTPPEVLDLSDLSTPSFIDMTLADQHFRVAQVWVNVAADDQPAAFALVQIAETTNKRAELARSILQGVSVPQLVMLPIAVLLIWLGFVRGMEPLTRLQERLRRRTADDFSPIDPNAAPAEMRVLVTSFNELLTRLDGGQLAHRNFIANAAHQLKTPLAGLRTQVELALRAPTSAHERQQLQLSLEQIAIGTERATRVVQQLLALAKVEDPLRSQQAQPIDLSQLAAQAIAQWYPAAVERQHDLGFEESAGLHIMGQAGLLTELISNLVDNAIKYTPRGGRITVRVLATPDSALLEVEDNGLGVPTSEQAAIFDRFYRILGSNEAGSGLGLAIVKEIAQAHSAVVTLRTPAVHVPREDSVYGPGLIVSIAFARLSAETQFQAWQPAIEP